MLTEEEKEIVKRMQIQIKKVFGNNFPKEWEKMYKATKKILEERR